VLEAKKLMPQWFLILMLPRLVFQGMQLREAQETEFSPNHVPCDHPVPEAPRQDAARSEAVASLPTEGATQSDEDAAESASASSSAGENAPADSGAAQAVP
jgi:hypothetical protein